MDPIDQLKRALEGVNRAALAQVRLEDLSRIERELPKLKQWIGGGTGMDHPGQDRIVEALRAYKQTQQFTGVAHARLVCHGFTQVLGSTRLIEEPKRFAGLLEYVDQHHMQPRPFRRCYRGLLNGYFSYDPENDSANEAGNKSWRHLRVFLDQRKDCLNTPGFNPEWVSALNDHSNLLTSEPCRRYGLAALTGDRSAFDDIRERLEIRDDSWVIRSLVLAQVDAAIALSDTKFKPVVSALLELLGEHPLLIDIGLSRLIERYAESRSKDVHAALRDFAVTHWKNPWLPSNDARWGSVRQDARDMIAAWLKLQLIQQFFSLLAEDGSNDTRRVEFWKQYHDEIEDMYFALGSTAMHNRSSDFKEMRKAMDGRLLRLCAAGANTNNAFIMMIGEYAVVEFGTAGNAAFIFNREHLPFELRGDVAGNASGLKNQDAAGFVTRLVHRDTSYHRWEKEFAGVLRRRVGVSVDARQRPVVENQRGRQGRTRPVFSEAALVQFAKEHRLLLSDLRSKGGNVWVTMSTPLDNEAREKLSGWGFRWSDKRRAFFRDK